LAITNVQFIFPGAAASGSNVTMIFDQPRAVPYPVPFGQCLFMDTTFLPGTLVFDLFGHEIQLIPRVLTIDKQEQPWRANSIVTVTGTNHLQSPASAIKSN